MANFLNFGICNQPATSGCWLTSIKCTTWDKPVNLSKPQIPPPPKRANYSAPPIEVVLRIEWWKCWSKQRCAFGGSSFSDVFAGDWMWVWKTRRETELPTTPPHLPTFPALTGTSSLWVSSLQDHPGKSKYFSEFLLKDWWTQRSQPCQNRLPERHGPKKWIGRERSSLAAHNACLCSPVSLALFTFSCVLQHDHFLAREPVRRGYRFDWGIPIEKKMGQLLIRITLVSPLRKPP